MKILFVYPNVTRQKSPQLGICMIAAIARQLGHECDIFDLTTIPKDEVLVFKSKIDSFSPDILAVSCRSNEWLFINHLLKSVNVGNILKVFGGSHATVAPEEVIEIADVVVMGEGEETFSELLNKIESGEDIINVAGCWIKQNGRIIKNEMRKLVPNLDTLPFPYWAIFDDIHYSDSYIKNLFNGAEVVGTFEISRGCPYSCTYCTNDYVRTLYKGKGKWRREKSVERVMQEIKQFRDEYGLDYIYWIDEVMLTKVDWLEKFRDVYSSEVGVPFVFMERPENMTDEKVRIISQAGAHRVSIGIESGDDNMRRNILNRHHSRETIVSAFQTAHKYNIITHAFSMVGFPGEDRKSINETYKLLKEAKPDTVQTTIFYPLKGTHLFKKVIDEELFTPDLPMPNSYYKGSFLNFSKSRKKEILRYQFLLTNYKSKTVYFLVMIHFNIFLMVVLNKIIKRLKRI